MRIFQKTNFITEAFHKSYIPRTCFETLHAYKLQYDVSKVVFKNVSCVKLSENVHS